MLEANINPDKRDLHSVLLKGKIIFYSLSCLYETTEAPVVIADQHEKRKHHKQRGTEKEPCASFVVSNF